MIIKKDQDHCFRSCMNFYSIHGMHGYLSKFILISKEIFIYKEHLVIPNYALFFHMKFHIRFDEFYGLF